MRFDAETASSTYVENVVADASVNERAQEANDALREGIKAAQAGDRSKARTALLRSSELDPQSESAWLWLASISEYPEELVVFLTNVLDINPRNARANEWMAATKSLLAKTFVQRGIDAMDSGQKEIAAQCFDQALEHDQTNVTAWLWLANLSESNEGKVSFLEKALEIDPENATARAAHDQAKHAINQALLAEARSAAVAGRKADAHDLLDAFIVENPDSEDGWILRSLLAEGFAEKITAFEKVLQINPENLAARSGRDSLRSIMQTVEAMAPAAPAESPDAMENTAFAIEQERNFETEVVHDKSPTQDLVFPEAAFALVEREETPIQTIEVEAVAEEEPESAFQPEESAETENADWSMNTVAFSFAFPAGEMDAPKAEENASANDSFEFSATPEFDSAEVAEAPASFIEPELELGMAEVVPEDVHQFEIVESTEPTELEASFAHEGAPAEHYGEFESSIPMPASFEAVEEVHSTGFETTVVRNQVEELNSARTSTCPYCSSDNPDQAFTCGNCLSTLTLSDLEMMLANTHADKTLVRAAVERLEAEQETRPFSENDLTLLAIGHLNLRNFETGYDYLVEASRTNPNNVVLASQANALHIRVEEIKEQEAAHDAMPKGKSILVVDDSATVRKLIAGKLEKSGHEVICAADGVEAIEQLDSVIPDLILLDITMPRMDGYQVCKVIRSKESTKDIPVVMISGKDGFFDKVRGRMAGTTGYITKPFGPETLMKAVETYLKGEQL